MNKINIKFNDVTDVSKFVHILSKYDADFNLYCGSYCVDAKSLLGMLYLGICKDLVVKYGEQDESFEHVMNKYAIA